MQQRKMHKLSSREECALGMEQSAKYAAMKNAQTEPCEEECALGMGPR